MPLDDNTIETAIQNVQIDVEGGFEGVLTALTDGFQVGLVDFADAQAVTSSDLVVTVPWSYRCTHTGRFLEIDPTFVELELRGITAVQVDGESDDWRYHRYIDFLGAVHQIGV